MQLAGFRVAVRVRGVAAGQGAAEVAGADGVEFVGEFVVGARRLDERQGLAGMVRSHWCWRRSTHAGAQSVRPVCARRGPWRDRGAAHPAIAVPLAPCRRGCGCRAPCRRPRTSDRSPGRPRRRVGPVAQVAPVEVVRNVPSDLEINGGHLGTHRRHHPSQVWVVGMVRKFNCAHRTPWSCYNIVIST